MKLLTFRNASNADRVGVVMSDLQILDLQAAAQAVGSKNPGMFDSMLALIESGEAGLAAARDLERKAPGNALCDMNSVKIQAPIPRPPRMRSGSFFARHLTQALEGQLRILSRSKPDPEAFFKKAVEKAGQQPPKGYYVSPVYWFQDNFCVSGPDAEVKWPAYSNWIDYELELTAIIGKRGRDISKADADQYIFGYTILNDLSARDAQRQAMETSLTLTAKGKDFDGSYPMGPWIVTRDSIDIFDVATTLRVNGEDWGHGHSREHTWTFADLIAYASQASDLIPGEVFSSATVANCAGMEHARQGARGDVVELIVDGIGTLRTKIV